MLAYHQYGEPPEYEGISESLVQLYRLRTAQCLIIGDMAKCLPYTLETLRFNATAELNRQDDSSRGLWIMTGVIVRVAINMGYHRDPSQLSSISILQAEYRRRVWLSVIVMDDVASFLAGFPRMMQPIYSDTMEPINIHDWELSVDATVLPPSRPLTELTPVTYMIVKGRLVRALGRVTDFNNTPTLGSYDSAIEIDNSLYKAYQNFPQHMKVPAGRADPDTLKNKSLLANLNLKAMYHQGMCALHRRFIAKGRVDPQFRLSHDRCISSALALLDLQFALESSWYISSHTRKMLTLAAMILFLEFEHRHNDPDIDTLSDNGTIILALENSCALWDAAKGSCDEAWKLNQILASLLSNCRTAAENTSSQSQNSTSLSGLSGASPQFRSFTDSLSLDKDLFVISDEMDIDWVGFPSSM
jgi:hypothetical protein